MPSTTCRHIKTNGARCGSPALTGKPRCYFHDRSYIQGRLAAHRQRQNAELILHPLNPGPDGAQCDPLTAEYFTPPPADLDFPTLEDRESIQLSVSMVLSALGRNEIDLKRAGMMLYALQVASANAKSMAPPATDTVSDTVLDSSGNLLAPDEDPVTPDSEMGPFERLRQKWAVEDQHLQNQDFPATIQQNQDFDRSHTPEGIPTPHLHS